jgi:hypothetical protein
VLTPFAVHVVDVLVNNLFGAPLPTLAQLSHWPDVPVAFVMFLVMVGIGEEAGWTAFAAPVLLRRHGLAGAWAVLSVMRIVWHLPLMLNGEMPWLMGIVGNAAFQMLVLLLLIGSGRWSVAAVWHATLNAFGGAFFFTMVTGADRVRLGLLLSAAYAILALVVLAWRREAWAAGARVGVGPASAGGRDHAERDDQRPDRVEGDGARPDGPVPVLRGRGR